MDSNIKKYGLENESAWCIEAHKIVNHMYGEHPYEYHLNLVFKFAVQFIELLPETLRRDCLVASWAHDTIEDCRLTYNDVKKVLGENVAEIVYALTNEKGKTRKERANDKYYEGIRNTPGAVYVKLCDRLANIHHSVSINSRMVDVYRKENVEFLHNMGDPNE
ncbi:HD domain-containing protein, partial [bacterium]|nr:HD domain-containing protein [bacterium]